MNQREFVELVASSRSYRRFDESRPVSREQLEELVACARLAPTGNNTQLLRFHLSFETDEVLEVFSHHRWAALLRDWDGPEPGERPTAYVTVRWRTRSALPRRTSSRWSFSPWAILPPTSAWSWSPRTRRTACPTGASRMVAHGCTTFPSLAWRTFSPSRRAAILALPLQNATLCATLRSRAHKVAFQGAEMKFSARRS